ncbi:MAG: DUF6600 domain-containing protein [Chitinophagaceae bacterium]
MKRLFKIAAFAMVMMLGSSLRNTVSAQYDDDDYGQNREVSYQDFYDELSPHGRWIDYPGTGYVWVPDAGEDFRPYSTNGHWVWTEDYEWMWVSDYDWGWAPFHYGRWDNDPYYGWYWVPGYEWSPAWVAWRDGGDYYGWAPIRPGISISINFNIGGYSPPNDFWCFAPRRYITSPRIYDYCVDRRQNVTIINYTTIIVNNYHYSNNYGFRSGPRRYDAERYCGRINPVRFRESYRPGRSEFRNNEVSVYRPRVRQDNNRSYTPRSFERYDRNNSNTGFRRNDNNGQRDNRSFDRRDDNTPDRRDRIERRDDNIRQPQRDNNNNTDRRRFERNDNNRNDQPNRDGDRRVIRPTERTERNPNPGNGNNDNRRFERRDNNNGNPNIPVRQPETRRQVNNPPQRQQDVRRNDNERPQRQPQTFERRQDTRPQPSQQVERRQEPRQQPSQQVERRQEPRQQTQQQPTRQIERRDDGNRQQGGGDRGNGNGRRRF